MEDQGKQNSQNSDWPRMEGAKDYLKSHQVVELFDNITAQMIYERPVDPRDFMIEYLEKLQKARTTKMDYPGLFNDTNVESIYCMLDPTGKGSITLKQYREALATLGLEEFDNLPPGGDKDMITLEVFSREAKRGLMKKASTYYDKNRL